MKEQIRAAAEDLQGMSSIMRLDASQIADIITRHLAPWKQAADGMEYVLTRVAKPADHLKGEDDSTAGMRRGLEWHQDDAEMALANYRALYVEENKK